MLRRAAALAAALLLMLQTVSVPGAAAGSVYFTVVNETVLELSSATMPFWSGGYLYVSSYMFSSRDSVKELGLYYSYNSTKKMVVLYTSAHSLIFNMNDDTVIDGVGGSYYPPAVSRNGSIFLPVSVVADFFGMTYSNTRVSRGYVIRLRNSNSVLSDSMFIDAAASQLNARYAQYLKSLEPQSGGSSATVQPALPPAETGTETETDIPGKTVYLCFRVGDAQRTAAMLDLLRGSGYAAFYVTEQQIRENGGLIRRMIASGQAVGLIADGASRKQSVADQLSAANQALSEAANARTRLCYVENAGESGRAAAAAAGYSCLIPDINRGTYGLRNESNASYLLSQIEKRRGAVSVWCGDQATPEGLRIFLAAARKAGDRMLGATELS